MEGRPLKEMIFAKVLNVRGGSWRGNQGKSVLGRGNSAFSLEAASRLSWKVLSADNMHSSGSVMSKGGGGGGLPKIRVERT